MTALSEKPPSRTIGDRIVDLLEKQTWIVYVALAGLLYLFATFSPYVQVSVSGTAMNPPLSDGGRYLAVNKPNALCIDDAVQAPHPDNGSKAVRMVMALGGDRVVFDETGYRIAGRTTPMSAAWQAEAHAKGGDALTVPQGHVMLRRADPDAADLAEYEAFLMVADDTVQSVLIRALYGTGQSFWSPLPRPQTRCISTRGIAG